MLSRPVRFSFAFSWFSTVIHRAFEPRPFVETKLGGYLHRHRCYHYIFVVSLPLVLVYLYVLIFSLFLLFSISYLPPSHFLSVLISLSLSSSGSPYLSLSLFPFLSPSSDSFPLSFFLYSKTLPTSPFLTFNLLFVRNFFSGFLFPRTSLLFFMFFPSAFSFPSFLCPCPSFLKVYIAFSFFLFLSPSFCHCVSFPCVGFFFDTVIFFS